MIVNYVDVANWQHQANPLDNTRQTTMKPTQLNKDKFVSNRQTGVDSLASGKLPKGQTSQVVPLLAEDKERLAECEDVLQRGLGTFFEVGSALLTIREARLYRDTYSNFETYCHERWGIGRTYAWRVIGAAERLRLLPAGQSVQRPTNEFQMRPFLRLQAEAFPGAWQQVLARAKDGKVTSELIRGFITEIAPQEPKTGRCSGKSDRLKFAKRFMPGQIVALLHDAKRRIEKGENEQALEAIEKIDSLLFGP